jgi:hypothetical protein
MSEKKSYYGSIDFSKLLEQAKTGNKAFTKNENGKIYLNVKVWVNDELDKYGNCASFQSSFKGAQKEDKFYFGNLKESEQIVEEVTAQDIPDTTDLPF